MEKNNNYFVCNSSALCNGAICCTDQKTRPALCVGDYLRLSWSTGESITEIWHKKGDVFLFNRDEKPHEFQITLGFLMLEEVRIEVKYFWRSQQPSISLHTSGEYFELAKQALCKQSMKDPYFKLPRTETLSKAIRAMVSNVKNEKLGNGVDNDTFISFLAPVAYTLYEDEIAEKMESLESDVLELYRKTTEKLENLIK
ncbi:hypothetical protein HYZ41_02600 [archaeon]|nr:hypothetical protein [archaeon]